MDTLKDRIVRVRMRRNIANRFDLQEGKEHDLPAEEAEGFVQAHLADCVEIDSTADTEPTPPVGDTDQSAESSPPKKPTRTRKPATTPE